MTHRIIPAIMSGGAGTRLWPLSTDAAPKQFHALFGKRSLFADTSARLSGQSGDISFAPPIVLCGETHAPMAEAALGEIGATASAIVIEPAARNTAAVAAVAAAIGREVDEDALVLLVPSDHLVGDVPAFHATIARAAPFARERIVTFGMAPTHPATGYGYIKRGAELGDGVFAIQAFKEKPTEATARGYLDAGGYSWNGGMFMFAPAVLLGEFGANAAIRDSALEAVRTASRQDGVIRLGKAYASAPSLPIDIAVMEETAKGAIAPCSIGWADIGSWDEIWRLSNKDGDDNALKGAAVAMDGRDNLLFADGVTLAVAGVENLIVVATRDAVLIVPRDRAQDVKALRDLAKKKL
ncbi:MAG: mannose-1-phosphate guanylyltransferase [Hyphomonadaceae bacterium]